MQTLINIGKIYFQYFVDKKLEEVCELFAPKGVVKTSRMGTSPYRDFYVKTMPLVDDLQFQRLNVYGNMEDQSVLIHFQFEEKDEAGESKTVQGIDILKFDEDEKITSLEVIHR